MEVGLFGLFKKKIENLQDSGEKIDATKVISPVRETTGSQTGAESVFLASHQQEKYPETYLDASNMFSEFGTQINNDNQVPYHQITTDMQNAQSKTESERTSSADLKLHVINQEGIFSSPLPTHTPFTMPENKTSTSPSFEDAKPEDSVLYPLELILQFLPNDVMSQSYRQKLSSPKISTTYVALPLQEILSQIPTGKIELPLNTIAKRIPSEFLRPGVNLEQKIALPFNEIVNRLTPVRQASTNNNPAKVDKEHLTFTKPPNAIVTAQYHQQRAEPLAIFGQLAAKATPSGGSGTSQTGFPEAPPPGLGFPKPKPPPGAISHLNLKNHPQESALGLRPDVDQTAKQTQPPFETLHSATQYHLFDKQQTSTDTEVPSSSNFTEKIHQHTQAMTQTFPKIAPPPTGATFTPSDKPLPNILLAPTTKPKSSFLGVGTRVGQSSTENSRENLAKLAMLAARAQEQIQTKEQQNSSRTDSPISSNFIAQSPAGLKTIHTYSNTESLSPTRDSDLKRSLAELAVPDSETSAESNDTEESHSNVNQKKFSYIRLETSTPEKDNLNKKIDSPTSIKASDEVQNIKNISNPILSRTQKKPTSATLNKTDILKPLSNESQSTVSEQSPSSVSTRSIATAFRLRPLERSTKVGTETFYPTSVSQNKPNDLPQKIDNKVNCLDELSTTPSSLGTASEKNPQKTGSTSEETAQFSPPPSHIESPRTTPATSRNIPSRASLNLSFSLARWLGLESDSPVPIESVPLLLTNSPYIKGAAVVDAEELTLASHLPHGLSESAIGPLTLRLYQQAKSAAAEVGSPFEGQCVVSLGRWTLQITHASPFYLVTFHDGLDFPPALARRLRKVAAALARQETIN